MSEEIAVRHVLEQTTSISRRSVDREVSVLYSEASPKASGLEVCMQFLADRIQQNRGLAGSKTLWKCNAFFSLRGAGSEAVHVSVLAEQISMKP